MCLFWAKFGVVCSELPDRIVQPCSERTTYTFPCTLLKEAQLSSLALSPPGQASLATVPPNPTQKFSITSRSSYARRLVAVTGTVRLHARTEGAPTMHGTCMQSGELANSVKGSGTPHIRPGRAASRPPDTATPYASSPCVGSSTICVRISSLPARHFAHCQCGCYVHQ
jgi:hypothetical protein